MQCNDMQLRFVKAYSETLDAGASALMAGYKTAAAGERLMKTKAVKQELDKVMKNVRVDEALRTERILLEISRLAFACLTDYLEIKDGKLIVYDTDTLTPTQKSALAFIKQTKEGAIEIRIADKLKALELLGRHLEIFQDVMQPVVIIDDVSTRK